jgi:HEAT repeat protein
MKKRLVIRELIPALALALSISGCGSEEASEEAPAMTEQVGTGAEPARETAPEPAKDPEKVREIQSLIAKLHSGDERAAYDAVLRLSMVGDETAVDPLITVAQLKTGMMRVAAIKALGGIGDRRALPVLLNALRDRSVDVRRTAAAGLGNLGDESATQPLIEALRDEDDWVGMNAQGSLEKITRQDLQTYDAWRNWYAGR